MSVLWFLTFSFHEDWTVTVIFLFLPFTSCYLPTVVDVYAVSMCFKPATSRL